MEKRKTKIVATVGPASGAPEQLARLIEEGVDAMRLNFSHGTHATHREWIRSIRTAEKKAGRPIAIIGDLQGPKMRVGSLPKEGVQLNEGDTVILDASTSVYRNGMIPMPSPIFRAGTRKGSKVFLDDGTLLLEILGVSGAQFTARVLRGGILYSHKGINVPMLELRRNIFEAKDRADIAFAKKEGVDYVALSFVSSAKDVRVARKILGSPSIKLISKIERHEALANLKEIIEASDAVMVARGDLGIETPLWELPVRQKEIIDEAHRQMKPVIVATQMLESMTRNPIATRAEVSDVANAVYDSADAVMLSAESASGKYPIESVRMMRRILEETELHTPAIHMHTPEKPMPVNMAIAQSAKYIAAEIQAKFILAGTETGFSALAVSRFRPTTPILALTRREHVARLLALAWGVAPVVVTRAKSVESLSATAIRYLKSKKKLMPGDTVVFVSGTKVGEIGKSNRISVVRIE